MNLNYISVHVCVPAILHVFVDVLYLPFHSKYGTGLKDRIVKVKQIFFDLLPHAV